MKITAASVLIILALTLTSGTGAAAPPHVRGGIIAPLNLTMVQAEPDLGGVNRSGCAKWKQFSSTFSLKPAQSILDQQPGGAKAEC